MSTVDKILESDKLDKKAKKNVNWGQKLPSFLKLNMVFSIVSLVGLIMGCVAGAFIVKGHPGTRSDNFGILWTSVAFFGIGYLFGMIYSACLYGLFPQSAKTISLLKAHYIINFVPIANIAAFVTAIIINKRQEYNLV